MLTFVRLADQIIRRRSDERQMARISNAFDIMARRLGSRGVLGRDFTPNGAHACSWRLQRLVGASLLAGASQTTKHCWLLTKTRPPRGYKGRHRRR